MTSAVIHTIGHSTRPLEALLALLREQEMACLVDIRTLPRSRYLPHFNTEALSRTLPAAGVAYRHLPALGGLRKARPDSTNTAWRHGAFRGYADYMETPAFEEGLNTLMAWAAEQPTAIMCAEAVPGRCHRALVSDALTARGLTVRHILGPGDCRLHALTPSAKVTGPRVRYPGEQQPVLF